MKANKTAVLHPRTTHGTRHGKQARMQGGFTLPEIMTAMTILGLLLFGAMGIFVTMLRLGGSVTGSVSASLDAGNAIQHITSDFREARRFSLLDNATYNAVDASNNVVAVTGIQMTFPTVRAQVTVAQNAAGTSTVNLASAGGSALWDQKDGPTLTFFRANLDGTPNPNSGTCLWARGSEFGQAVDGPIIKSIAPTQNAVQFIQPYVPGSNPAVPIPNQVKIKLTTSNYDIVHGTTSSENAGGGVTQLSGECVFLRDHDPSGTSSTTTNGRAQD